SLINACIEKSRTDLTDINFMVSEKNYEGLVQFLKRKAHLGWLDLKERGALKIAEDILTLQETGELPVVASDRSSNVYEAIFNSDYLKAYAFDAEFRESDFYGAFSIHMLLQELYDLMMDNMLKDGDNGSIIGSNDILMDGYYIVMNVYDESSFKSVLYRVMNEGVSLEEACLACNLDKNGKALVYLGFAKLFLSSGRCEEALQLVQYVRMLEYKSNTVKKALKEVEMLLETPTYGQIDGLVIRSLRRIQV
ncbi:MAG: hypothetical protein K2M17_03155, partial [Bacilli bacterium]|nr:hypothetical protein [Bacilli bacterium]